MARKEVIELLDDIDGTKADETLKFALDGTLYEIDLSNKHADKLRSSLAQYITRARKLGRGGVAPTGRGRRIGTSVRTEREQNQAVRDWAKAKGLDVSDRGRIPANVLAQYQAEAGR